MLCMSHSFRSRVPERNYGGENQDQMSDFLWPPIKIRTVMGAIFHFFLSGLGPNYFWRFADWRWLYEKRQKFSSISSSSAVAERPRCMVCPNISGSYLATSVTAAHRTGLVISPVPVIILVLINLCEYRHKSHIAKNYILRATYSSQTYTCISTT